MFEARINVALLFFVYRYLHRLNYRNVNKLADETLFIMRSSHRYRKSLSRLNSD